MSRNITFALSGLKFGGGMKILLSLAEQLGKRGHNVTIATPDVPDRAAWAELKHVKFLTVPLHRSFAARVSQRISSYIGGVGVEEIRACDEIMRFAEMLPKSDVTIATSPLTALGVALNGQSSVSFNYLQHYEPLIFSDPLIRRFARLSPILPLRVIANSTWLKQTLINDLHVNPTGVIVLPSAVDTDLFRPKPKANDAVLRIVMMGKPQPWKGFREAIDAMKLVFARHRNIEWIVYAEKDEFPKDPRAPYVLRTGLKGASLAELIATADIVMVPSWYESSPLPVLEAIASGAALVTTPVGVEDLVRDGIDAIIVPPKDAVALANAVNLLLENETLRARLSSSGPTRAQQFSWPTMTDRFEALLEEALSNV